MGISDASKGIYGEEQYKDLYPGVTVYFNGESFEFFTGHDVIKSEQGFSVVYQPRESWLPTVEVAYFQGTCSYVKHIHSDKVDIA